MSNALDPSSSTTASPSTRRSTRPKRSSDTPKPSPASSVLDTGMSGSRGGFSDLGDTTPRRKSNITQSNPHPWMHPQELRYICDKDFPQNVLIQYLCSKAFSIPPREANSTIPLFHITTRHGTSIGLPRAYRVPLMFVVKFQWDSLKLVLTSPDPKKEWDEYKFDIIHLCRLCERLFVQATEAQEQAAAAGGKGFDRLWRSATFDRVLTRFYHRWFVSREWSIRKFWEEFDDDEYDGDILKHDWTRWSVKGHKGFALTKDQIHRGITAQQFMHGLSKTAQGTWIWDDALPLSTLGPLKPSLDSSFSTGEPPIVVEDEPNSNGTTLAHLEKVFDVCMDTGTPSHNTIEVKKERLEVVGENPPTIDVPSSEIKDPTVPTSLESSHPVVTASVVDIAGRRLPNDGSTNIDKPLGGAERPTSPVVGQKRPRSPVSNQEQKERVAKRTTITARKSLPIPWILKHERRRQEKSTFGGYLETFRKREVGQLPENDSSSADQSNSSSDDDQESCSSEDGDDPMDGDYRGPRNSRAKAAQSSSKSDSATRVGQASNTSPLTVVLKVPTTNGPIDSQSMGSSCNPPVVATEFRVIPASPSGVIVPSSTSIKPNTPNLTEPLVFPITHQVTPSVTNPATASDGSPDSRTTTAKQVLSSGEALSISEIQESAPTPSKPEPVAAGHDALPTPSPLQNGIPVLDNSSNSITREDGLVAFEPILSPQHVSEVNGERVPEGAVVKEKISDLPVAEIEIDGCAPDVGPDSSVDRHADPPKCSAGAEPRTSSTIDTGTSPPTDVPQGSFSVASSSISKQVDHMNVGDPAPTSDPVEDLHGMLAALLSDPSEIKVRRAVLLLHGLLRSILTTVDGEDTIFPSRHPLSSSDVRYTFADGETPLVMEEHLELVVKCSSLLSKYFSVYKGRELEEQMTELDGRLQKELSNMRIVQNLATESDARAGKYAPVRVDKAVATVIHEDHPELRGQGQETEEGLCQVEKPDSIMQDSATDIIARQSLTPEATMVDLSSDPPTTTSNVPDILKIELVSGTIPPATRLMTSMMRNLADLLDCTCGTCGANSDDLKGKGRALDTVSSTTIGLPCDLLRASPLLDEFKLMTEEMRKIQQRNKEEVESAARLHRAEVISLKEQMRATEDKYRRDTELLRQSHREEMDSLTGGFRGAEKQREKATAEVEGKLPLLEMLELRRRVTALETHTRSLTHSPSQAGRSSRLVCEDESDITIIRRPPFHPLGHLFDYEDVASPLPCRSSPDGVTLSKPGTPIQSESSNAVFIDSIPLPIKSQRKFQSMHRVSLT